MFICIWLGGTLILGRALFHSEAFLRGWLNGLSLFHPIGLFEYSSDEDLDDAVLNSLLCLWGLLAAWGAWRLNRKLKRCQE